MTIEDCKKMFEIKNLNITPNELKTIYHKLARNNHPDYAVDDEDLKKRTEAMQKINEAYEILGKLIMNGQEKQSNDIQFEYIRRKNKIIKIAQNMYEILLETLSNHILLPKELLILKTRIPYKILLRQIDISLIYCQNEETILKKFKLELYILFRKELLEIFCYNMKEENIECYLDKPIEDYVFYLTNLKENICKYYYKKAFYLIQEYNKLPGELLEYIIQKYCIYSELFVFKNLQKIYSNEFDDVLESIKNDLCEFLAYEKEGMDIWVKILIKMYSCFNLINECTENWEDEFIKYLKSRLTENQFLYLFSVCLNRIDFLISLSHSKIKLLYLISDDKKNDYEFMANIVMKNPQAIDYVGPNINKSQLEIGCIRKIINGLK